MSVMYKQLYSSFFSVVGTDVVRSVHQVFAANITHHDPDESPRLNSDMKLVEVRNNIDL